MVFNIPAQPLASALERYGDATGREVLYSAGLVEGRRSGVVAGMLAPEEALRKLLKGTDLSARFIDDGSFVLLPASPTSRLPVAQASPPAVQQQYYAHIQASLMNALCESSETKPGHYRLAALLWLNASGAVSRYERLNSAGTADLDWWIDDTLRNLRIDAPPPGFAQPILVMILPRKPGVTMGCESGSAGRHALGAGR